MTIIEKSSFTGLAIDGVRPHARVRKGQQLKTVAEDQAYLYKTLTGNAVPNAPGSDVATDHTHDGTTGQVIPLPLLQIPLGARMVPGGATGTFTKLVYTPFFAPAGQTALRLHVWTDNAVALTQLARARIESAPGTITSVAINPSFENNAAGSGMQLVTWDITATGGAVNLLIFEVWDGTHFQDGSRALYEFGIHSLHLLPWPGEPISPVPTITPVYQSTRVDPPDTTEHVGAHAFTSFDDAMFNDDRGTSSYIVQRQAKNEAYLFERATGQPAGDRDTTSNAIWQGHTHGGSTSPSTKAVSVGAEMDHALGAWFYGTARRLDSTDSNHSVQEQSDNNNDNWTGKITAPFITSGTAFSIISYHPLRLPAGLATSYAASGKVKGAALCYFDDDLISGNTGEVRVSLYDSTGVTAGTAITTSAFSTNGYNLVTWSGLDISGSGTGEEIQMLRVDLRQTTNQALKMGIYGACLYFEG